MIIEGTPIVAVQWSAILDELVCPLCEKLDGQVADINDPEFAQLEPPIHARCRCIKAYIGQDEFPANRTPDFLLPPKNLLQSYAGFKVIPDESLPHYVKDPEGRQIEIFPDLPEGGTVDI